LDTDGRRPVMRVGHLQAATPAYACAGFGKQLEVLEIAASLAQDSKRVLFGARLRVTGQAENLAARDDHRGMRL